MSKLFGGGTPQVNYTPQGFYNPTGFSVTGDSKVLESPTLSSNIGNLQNTFQQQAGAFSGLAKTVQPGFSQFRQAGLRDIANQFMSRRSNLQDTLAQRRIFGSSFGNSAFNQLAADEAQTKANFEASSYLQELQASYDLIQAQYTSQTKAYSTAIDQSNIEAQIAASLTASNNRTAAAIAEANAKLEANAQAGQGALVGLGISMLGKWAGTGFAGPGGATLSDLISGAAVLA